MSFRFRWLVLVASVCVVALMGCKSRCDQAADVLVEKCGNTGATSKESAGEECAADSEILADCVNENDGKTCAEIQAACFAP